MTIRRGAGKARGGRGSIIRQQTTDGIYRETVCGGMLQPFTDPGGGLPLVPGGPMAFTPGLDIPMFLFGSDHPNYIEGTSLLFDAFVISDGAARVVPMGTVTDPEFNGTLDLDPTTIPHTGIITAAKASYLRNERQKATTVTNGVAVDGYMYHGESIDRSYVDEKGDPSLIAYVVKVGSEGALVTNRGATMYDALGAAEQASVIMPEALYTQEIYDAGNEFVDSLGTLRFVCGIYGAQIQR